MASLNVAPPYWLVFGLAWPPQASGPIAEAAMAVAPASIPREVVSPGTLDVFAVADAYTAGHPRSGQQVVFFSDITRWLATHGQSWGQRGTDWEATLDELHGGPFLSLFLEISNLAHVVVCDASIDGQVHGVAEEPVPTSHLRDDVRQALFELLDRDWAPYARQALAAAGRVPQ